MRSIEVKAAIITALLFMILMRLVWMDLRSYVIVYAPENHRLVMEGTFCQKESWRIPPESRQGRPSWGDSLIYKIMLKESCHLGYFSEGSFIRYNQGFLILTILVCMVFSRIITRSWVIALLVGLALMSRGRLIASSGSISGDHLIMFGLSLWAMFTAHWIRSGSRIILGLLYLSVLWLVDLEFSFVALGLVPLLYALAARTRWARNTKHVPDHNVFWPALQNFLGLKNFHIAEPEQATGGPFRPLPQTVAKPLREERFFKTFLKETAISLTIILGSLAIMYALRSYETLGLHYEFAKTRLWGQLFLMTFDRDVILSLASIGMAILIPTFVLPALKGFNLAIILGIGLTIVSVYLVDHIYLPADASGSWLSSQIMLWWEPLILALGVLGFYHSIITLTNQGYRLFRPAEETST